VSADNSAAGDADTFSEITAGSADSQAFAHPIALLTVLLTALLMQPSTALQLNVIFLQTALTVRWCLHYIIAYTTATYHSLADTYTYNPAVSYLLTC
jgi:hypothetical protein